MKIIVDENIAYAREAFENFGTVVLAHGRAIDNAMLKDADALIVRSITRVSAELLEGTAVRFVGTATIGTDHIDKAYLAERGITFADAKGCNADAVTDYVFTAIFSALAQRGREPDGLTLGVIGCGNIGGRVSRIAPRLGFRVLKNDPPLARITPNHDFVTLEEALRADIITLHTPLNRTGIDKTMHLFTQDTFSKMPNCFLFLNACRGEVVETSAMKHAIAGNKLFTVLDVWENEPVINAGLLTEVDFASPHVAGYSYEGKVNGTVMMHDALARHLGLPHGQLSLPLEKVAEPDIFVSSAQPFVSLLNDITRKIYSLETDTVELKRSVEMPDLERGKYFDALRKNYNLRREFSNFTVHLEPFDSGAAEKLRALRFNAA